MEEEKMEEGKKKSNKKLIIIIIMSIIIVVIAGIIVYKLLNRETVEEDIYKNVVRDKVSIERLNKVVTAGMYNDFGYEGLAYDFAKGVKGLTDEQKSKLILQYLLYVVAEVEKVNVEELSEKYKSDEILGNPNNLVQQLSGRSFEKEYENIFGKSPKFDEKSLKESGICPGVYKYDSRTRKIYLYGDCKQEGDTLLVYKTYNFKFEDDYYYVYQYVGLMKPKKAGEEKDTYTKISTDEKVDIETFSGNENKFETLIWKFDKDYNFISTTLS